MVYYRRPVIESIVRTYHPWLNYRYSMRTALLTRRQGVTHTDSVPCERYVWPTVTDTGHWGVKGRLDAGRVTASWRPMVPAVPRTRMHGDNWQSPLQWQFNKLRLPLRIFTALLRASNLHQPVLNCHRLIALCHSHTLQCVGECFRLRKRDCELWVESKNGEMPCIWKVLIFVVLNSREKRNQCIKKTSPVPVAFNTTS